MADQGEQSKPLFQEIKENVADKLEAVSEHLNKGKWGSYDKAEHIAFGCYGAVDPEVPYYDSLQKDLANSYYWSKNLAYDYVFYLANWHPLLGLFLSHPNHPWTKWERCQMFILSLSLTIIPATFIAIEQDDGYFDKVPAGVLKGYTIAFITIPDFIIGILMYQLSIAETRCPSCYPILTCIRVCKNCCCVTTLVFAVLISFLCIWTIHKHDKDAAYSDVLPPLIFGTLYSYIIWIPLFTLLPCGLGFLSGWCNEKNEPPETANDEPSPPEGAGDA